MTDQTAEAVERLKVFMGWNAKPMPADDEDFTSYVSEAINNDLALLLADRERLRLVLKPFAELTQPSFDDDAPPRHGDVHLMIMGDGELGDLPLSAFWNAEAALNPQGEGE